MCLSCHAQEKSRELMRQGTKLKEALKEQQAVSTRLAARVGLLALPACFFIIAINMISFLTTFQHAASIPGWWACLNDLAIGVG
jgi:hypothetical protein